MFVESVYRICTYIDKMRCHCGGIVLALLALSVSVSGQLAALCNVDDGSGVPSQNISGTISMEQSSAGGPVIVTVDLTGFDPNDDDDLHGFHVHQNGDLGNQCSAAGGHYNPLNNPHAAPENDTRHVGDLGNIEEDFFGDVDEIIVDDVISLRPEDSPRNIIGKAIVIHATRDDLGLGGDEGSRTSGNAGPRLGCCIIQEQPRRK